MFFSRKIRQPELTPVDDVEILPVPMLRELYRYWLSKKHGEIIPARDDIKPSELVALLSNIILIDVEPNSWRFRLRLVGTNVVSIMGADYTGRYLDQMTGTASMLRRFRWLVEHRKAYYSLARLDWIGRSFQKYHVLGLPLTNDQDKVNMILFGIEPFSTKAFTKGAEACA